jgi:hypothetical protein
VASKVALNLAKERKEKDQIDASAARKARAAHMKGTMKWLPFHSSFILEEMCELIRTDIHTDKGFKEVNITAVSKGLFKHCGAEVTSTQVYNHLRKWRTRWIHISKLRDLSGAQWDEDSFSVVLEAEHYQKHVTVSTSITLHCPLIIHAHCQQLLLSSLFRITPRTSSSSAIPS